MALVLALPNPFRGSNRAMHNKKGNFNPCGYCWRWGCKNCLVFVMADFAAVLRSDPKLAHDFDIHYNKFHGNIDTTRQERRKMDRNARVKNEKLEKGKKSKLKVVK